MSFVNRVLVQQWLGEKTDIDELFGAIEKTTDSEQLAALGQGLRALVGKLDAGQANAVVAKYVEAIEKTTDSGQLAALGQSLSVLADNLAADQKTRVLDAIGVSMLGVRSGVQSYFLAQLASAFLKGVRLNDQRARDWIEACRRTMRCS